MMGRWLQVVVLLLATGCAATVSEKDRGAARIRYDLGVANLNRADMRAALRELLGAVELDPELAEAHDALGLVYHALGHLPEALEHYRKAVELKPGFSEAHNNLGIVLTDMGRYDEAIAAFKKALGDILYATPYFAEGNMGWAYYKKGDAVLAVRHLRNALATNPRFCRGYVWLAQIGLETGKPDDVIANGLRFQKQCLDDAAHDVAPSYIQEMEYYRALGHLKSGDSDAARKLLAQCTDRGADDGWGGKCKRSLEELR